MSPADSSGSMLGHIVRAACLEGARVAAVRDRQRPVGVMSKPVLEKATAVRLEATVVADLLSIETCLGGELLCESSSFLERRADTKVLDGVGCCVSKDSLTAVTPFLWIWVSVRSEMDFGNMPLNSGPVVETFAADITSDASFTMNFHVLRQSAPESSFSA